jgi:hypothetical protein
MRGVIVWPGRLLVPRIAAHALVGQKGDEATAVCLFHTGIQAALLHAKAVATDVHTAHRTFELPGHHNVDDRM